MGELMFDQDYIGRKWIFSNHLAFLVVSQLDSQLLLRKKHVC